MSPILTALDPLNMALVPCTCFFDMLVVRYMQDFTPRPVNQAGAQGEEAGRRIGL